MDTYDKIEGRGIFDLLDHLRIDRTLVRFEISNVSLNGLTIVRELRNFWAKPHFLIDVPDGLWQSTIKPKTLGVFFEFTGQDKLRYRFRTNGGRLAQGEIWLRFPDYIKRLQQRESFRLQPREKVKMVISLGNESREMDVVDFSEGGALADFRPTAEEIQFRSTPQPGSYLYDVALVIPYKDKDYIVEAQRVLIKRVTADTATGRFLYGLKFTDINTEEKIKLNRLLCDLQRELLIKKRLSPQQ